jgi:Phosphatidylinositol-4-phosphate 5-Kinase
LNILQNYSGYFAENKVSQIGRIFGLFDVNFEDAGRSVKLFVMEALDPIYKDSILRKYDLKGSTSDRNALSSIEAAKIKKEDVVKVVMKDNDFKAVSQILFQHF